MTGVLIGLHLAAAVTCAAATAGGTLLGLTAAGRHRDLDRWLDRCILLLLAGAAAGILVGLVMLVQGTGPRDPLHLLYAAAALTVVPAVRAWTHRRAPSSRAAWLVVAFLVTAIVLLRLAMTA